MKIMGLGVDFSGRLLFPPRDAQEVVLALVNALEANAANAGKLTRITKRAVTFRGERERAPVDLGDPKSVGWTYLVNAGDPQYREIVEALQPLAKHRGMSDPVTPLLYRGESSAEWFEWLNDNYYGLTLKGQKVPQYVLIVGEPAQVPFLFQSVLGTAANVGRVAFDTLDDLTRYVTKLIRIETQDQPIVGEKALLFATDAGADDPTYFSRRYMAEPLAEHIRDELGFETRTLAGQEATKANLLELSKSGRPAMVFTASHGLGATNETAAVQRRYNGAICCQHAGNLTLDALFSADDVPLDQPFLEGAIFFQFACFGYGTPAQSDYAHWLTGVPKRYTDVDFIAALPKKLLAHPRGPIAFIGHLDTAFLHGFTDAESPHILDRWHTRLAPFKSAVDQLLRIQPSGLAMHDMSTRYNSCNALITDTYDRLQRGRLQWNDRLKDRFLDTWITRSDAQNYMIFGDPASHLRITTQ
jgi:hypothetical protein